MSLFASNMALGIVPASPHVSGWVEALLGVLLIGAAAAPWLRRMLARRALATADKRATEIFEVVPDAIVGIGEDGRIVIVNRHAVGIFGYEKEELAGQLLEVLLPERFRSAHVGQRRSYLAQPRSRGMLESATLVGRRKDGTEVPIDIALSQMVLSGCPLTLAFIRDVSAQRALLNKFKDANQRIEAELFERQQFRGMMELLQTLQSRDEVRSVLNLHMAQLFPETSGAVFLYSPSRDDLEPLVSWGQRPLDAERFMSGECWALRLGKPYGSDAAGSVHPCPHVGEDAGGYWCLPLVADGETLGVLHVRAEEDFGRPAHGAARVPPSLTAAQQQRIHNVAERLALPLANFRLRETLRNQSIRDGLTGVFNRRYMEESLVREIARTARSGSELSVVMLDIDHFKTLNDTCGHAVGDELLSAFGRFLSANVRGDDIVCRYGGEEFTLIFPGLSGAAAAQCVNDLKDAWARVTVDNRSGGRASATFSGGVSTFPLDGSNADGLVRTADEALYRAKSEGRNRVVTSGTGPVFAGTTVSHAL